VLQKDVERVSQREHNTGTIVSSRPNSHAMPTHLYSKTSFSSALPTTYSMTSDSILKTTTFPSYSIMSVVCLAVFSVCCVRLRHSNEKSPHARTQQPLLERLLVLHRLVRDLAWVVVLVAGRRVRVRVVLGEDARAIVDGEDEERLDAEEGEGARHLNSCVCPCTSSGRWGGGFGR
jgi:hypothetical protein